MERNNSLSNHKLNNDGFSLIEVLVAVIILALVAGPLLLAFTLSAKFNARAKVNQEVTVVAESIMETFKGPGMDKVITDYNSAAYPNRSASISGNDVILKENDYDFGATHNKYDVVVTAAPFFSGAPTSNVVNVMPISESKDYVFKQDLDKDQTVYQEILDAVYQNWKGLIPDYQTEHPSLTAEDKARIHVERTITASVSADTVSVVYTYNYWADSFTYESPVTGNTVAVASIPNTSKTEAFAPETLTGLDRIYLCFSPGYKDCSDARIEKDTINTDGCGTHFVYLLKQQNPHLSGNLSYMEAGYDPVLIVHEEAGVKYFYHNFEINMSTLSDDSTLHGRFDAISDNSLVRNPEEKIKADKVLMYKLEVKVYEEGASLVNYPPEKLLYTLEGSMNSD